ncbi:MAG: Crp/Fnr family transcriptional regulator [Nitrospira sp.]|jgi:CRP-like cAMP-binding protein|nr:Crp/Fnr family transcriptional regulator [Nitrospira sp.]
MARKPRTTFSSQSFLTTTGPGKKLLSYLPKQRVFSQGDPADFVFYIQKGTVKLSVLSPQGKEAVVAVLKKEHFFGEQCLSGHTVQSMNATVMDQVSLVRITKAKMTQVLQNEPSFSELFLKYVLSHSMRVEEDLVDQLFNSSEKRLARVLLLLANFGKKGKPQPTIPHVTQEMLADMIGTTRPRVNFFMNKFRQLGFIEYNGTLQVHSSLLNVVLHD